MTRFQRFITLPAFLLCSLLLNACSTTPPSSSAGAIGNTPEKAQLSAAKTDEKKTDKAPTSFPTETLFDLLVAEIAMDREKFAITLTNYAKQAQLTRDPGITERATHIAVMLNASHYAIELATLWVELEPNNVEANRIAAYFLTRSGQLHQAFPYAAFMLQNGESNLLRNISLLAASATDQQRQQLLDLYQQLPPDVAQTDEVLLTKATLLWQQGKTQQSLAIARQLNFTDTDNKAATLLTAQLLTQQGDTDSALAIIEKELDRETPDNQADNKQLRLEYARIRALKGDLGHALQQLSQLVTQHPDDNNLLYSLAAISAEAGLYEDAELLFRRLLTDKKLSLQASYQLARVLEQQGHIEDAIAHYRSVRSGPNMIPATARLSYLMAQKDQVLSAQRYLQELRHEQPGEAINLLNLESELLMASGQPDKSYLLLTNGLADHPDNIMLLYSRAMVCGKTGQYRKMEADLRTILTLQPNNATALNALGYALSNHSSNYLEAYELISKALALNPDDAATLDSMGWVLYRLKRYDEALVYLQKAYATLKDPEVSAHLGEVLWTVGRQQEALAIWKQGLQSNPEDPIISRTMKRLQTAS